MIGLDTGFFVELLRGGRTAKSVWERLVEHEQDAVCSALTLFEVERLGLKEAIDRPAAALLLEAIPAVCRIAWLDAVSPLSDAARLSHGLGIPAVDALILASLLGGGALTIYTTDEHIARYRGKGVKVVNVRGERLTSGRRSR